MRVTEPVIIELGKVNTSPNPVRIVVLNMPTSVTVPSLSPTRTYSPAFNVRE
ncbi:hypothetical protein D3C76_1692420 [compost metagenome]